MIFSYRNLTEHVRVYFENGDEVPLKNGALITEAPVANIKLSPNDHYENDEQLYLAGLYDLKSGKYRMRFFYDLSLLTKKGATESRGGTVEWSRRTYSFEVR